MINPSSTTHTEFFQALLRDFDAGTQVEDLARFVIDAAFDAANHKRNIGVQTRMERSLRAINNQYNPEDLALLEDNCVYMGITNLKVRAFKSWVSDILLNSEDRPFTIRPSPIPDLPLEVEDAVIDQFIEEVEASGFVGSITTRLAQLKQIARSHVERVTEAAAKNLEDVIHDQLTEGEWREAFDEFIDDLGSMPGAFIKGPHVEFAERLVWRDGKAKVVKEARYRMTRVSPFDIFPSPDSRTTQHGRYLVERARMGQSQLLDAANLQGFREASIRALIDNYPQGWKWDCDSNSEREAIEGTDTEGLAQQTGNVGGLYEVLVYYGQISGQLLGEWGLAELDAQRTYEAEVWVSGGIALRAILNPHPTGKRPFFGTSFDKIPGSFWGNGLPDLLQDVQRVGNAAIRSLIKNMAFSAGPIGEADMSRLTGEDDVTDVQPFRIYQVDNDTLLPSAQPALRFHNVLSNSRELMEIYERFMKQADDISGIPAYVLGNPQVAGAGRTLGGLSLLMGNAAKGIKKVISQVDKDVIEPMVTEYTTFNLMFSDNPDLKFDTFVVARGSTGLLQQELAQSRAVELIGLIAPFVTNGDPKSIVPAAGIQLVLRDIIRGLGYRADEIVPSPGRAAELSGFVGGGGSGGPAQPSLAPATPQPPLDGRSAAALPFV